MKTVLVTGAAGTMGASLVQGLVDKGFSVKGLVLPNDPLRKRLDKIDCEVVEGDISKPDSLAGVFSGVDIVYHLAAVILSKDPSVYDRVNVLGTRNVLNAAAGSGVEHFIYVSSASVVYPRTTPYSRSKILCEKMVRAEERMKYTIVRPTLVYDKDGGQEFVLFVKYLKMFPIVPFIGAGRSMKNPVFVDDIMDALLKLASNEKAYEKVYNFCGGQEISIRELAKLILVHHGGLRPFVSIPVWLCKLVARTMSMFMDDPPLTLSAIAGITQDANLDKGAAFLDLDYDPIGVHEGFRRCFPLKKSHQGD